VGPCTDCKAVIKKGKVKGRGRREGNLCLILRGERGGRKLIICGKNAEGSVSGNQKVMKRNVSVLFEKRGEGGD